jgi:phage baseplate assembly protein W
VAEPAVDIIGRGLDFPLRPLVDWRMRFVGGDEKIRQSIWLILSTSPGEREMRPEFGCGVHEVLFDANTSKLRGIVEEKVREALSRWEPRIDVLEVRAEMPPESRNHLLIRIDYRVRATNALYNLVYPLFVNEGAEG